MAFFQLPSKLEQRYLTTPDNQEIALIQINNHRINYFFNGNNVHRLDFLLKAVNDIINFRPRAIPNGNYFVNLRDGINISQNLLMLAFASTTDLVKDQQVILIPDHQALEGYTDLFKKIDQQNSKISWQEKIPKIFWRGATTGTTYYMENLNDFARGKFIQTYSKLPFVDAAFTSYTSNLNQNLLQYLQQHFPNQTKVTPNDAVSYKYLLDIDGYSCSYSRMAWILYSRSLLLKPHSNNIQWYYARLQPYVNYIPLKEDFSDLSSKFNWAQTHQQEVIRISENAYQLATEVFNRLAIQNALIDAFVKYHAISQ